MAIAGTITRVWRKVRHWPWWYIGAGLVSGLIVVFLIVPGVLLYGQALAIKSDIRLIDRANHARNFRAMKADLPRIEQKINALQATLGWMGYWDWVPGIGAKYRDGQEALAAIQLGLRGVNVMMPALTRAAPLLGYRVRAQGRLPALGKQKVAEFLKALPVMGPDLRRAYPDFKAAAQTLNKVHPRDFSGFLAPVGQKLATAQSLVDAAMKNMPLIYQSTSALQNILGDPTRRRYLLIFQNSGELRSTGGFMTAYGYLTLNHGHLGNITAQNMYLLDAQVPYHPPASAVIATYLPVYYWHLRDSNTSPDVPTTVSYIKQFYASIPGAPRINGVIFIDTWVVDQLIGDVGGITVPTPKRSVSLTEQDANIKMEDMAEGEGLPNNIRKKFIETMMKTLFQDVLHSRGHVLGKVLQTVDQGLNRKFILLYFKNPRDEAMVVRYNWGGVMDRHVQGDYLSVVDENLLGHKDNFEMSYHIRTRVTNIGGRYEETTSISYRDPALDNGWLFVPYRSWVRFYVPVGSKLISIQGVDGIPYEDYVNTTLNKTVFGGHVNLPSRTSKSQPVATHTVTVRYWLPPGISVRRLTIQLQPGVNHQTLTVADGSYHRTVPFLHDMSFRLP